jgi:hypothetical protein
VWERRSRRTGRPAVFLAALALLASAPSTSSVLVHRLSHHPIRSVVALAPREMARVERPLLAVAPARFAAPDRDEIRSEDRVIAPPPAVFDAPPPDPVAPPLALTAAAMSTSTAKQGGVWAVVIGIDDYPGSRSDLRASVADANEVDAALAAYGVPADRRLVLRNGQATAAMITASMRWLVDHAASDSTSVLFYAGHIRKLGGGTEAIVGADGRTVTDASMASTLRPLASARTWIALAACYAGGFDEVLAPGRILTAAADANNLAYENSSFGHSYLVEYMVHRAMNQRQAPGSVEQSFAWSVDALRREHPNRVPVQYDRLDGELRLGAMPAAAAQPSSPPPSQSPPPQQQPPPKKQDAPDDDGSCVITLGSLVGCDKG